MSYSISLIHAGDLARLAEIQWAALNSNPLTQVLYPRGPTEALIEFTTASYKRSYSFPSAKLIKATNSTTGEVVGFAKWILYRKDEELGLRQSVGGIRQKSQTPSRRSSGWEKEKHLMPTMPPDCHGTLLENWGNIINKTRKRITGPKGHACRTGAPCSLECYFSNFADNLWVLDIVHVVPLYQKNGVGAALIDWGLEQADKEGIECYVESSPAARPLCARRGFKHLGEMRVELGKYKEGYHDYRHSVMIRPPYGKEEVPEPLAKGNAFEDEPTSSPVSPFEDDNETPYTAEAKMLEFRSTSSLRSARLTDARASSRTPSKESNQYRDIPAPMPAPIPKSPAVAKLVG